MPELPEVERAVKLITRVALGKKVVQVEVVEDSIVFSGNTPEEFAAELTGRTVTGVKRYGKVFYITLDGDGKMPVLHFGMTGMLQVRGELPMYYREAPRKASTNWPPRFMKFNLLLQDPESGDTTELAFLDARRLGRIRLRASPATEPPISELGFDPILTMPTLNDFSNLVLKRSCPIKALLLDQSFSAGVGNWVADEVLYHARVHPQQTCNTLSSEQIRALHRELPNVCQTAIAVDADASKFPENWLFNHRWDKGKRPKKAEPLKLPNGDPASIKWITVGGRTSALVPELQALNGAGPSRNRGQEVIEEENADSESDLKPLEEDHVPRKVVKATKRQRQSARTPRTSDTIKNENVKVEERDGDSDLTPLDDDSEAELRYPKRRRKAMETEAKTA